MAGATSRLAMSEKPTTAMNHSASAHGVGCRRRANANVMTASVTRYGASDLCHNTVGSHSLMAWAAECTRNG